MLSLLDSPSPVNETAVSLTSPITRIQICEMMLSPFASRENAHWMVGKLRRLGWPVEYSAVRATWQFASFEEAARFRGDFDRILASACPPYLWPVYVPDEEGYIGPDWVATVAAVDVDTVRPAPVGRQW